MQVFLSEEEGGLNLAMKPGTIKDMDKKGKIAGEKLLDFNFKHHQWVRFQVLMGLLEKNLQDMEEVLKKRQFDCEELLNAQFNSKNEIVYFIFAIISGIPTLTLVISIKC